ncbi:hypothetical protein GCM10022206_86110 [Streptomyces chiangmaiensis]
MICPLCRCGVAHIRRALRAPRTPRTPQTKLTTTQLAKKTLQTPLADQPLDSQTRHTMTQAKA